MKDYPDISELVERKKRDRRRLAALPFEEKMEIVFRLRERRKFMRAADDEQRRGEAQAGHGDDAAGRRGE